MIIIKVQTTGDFINRDASLKGGITLTVLEDSPIDKARLESLIAQELAPNEVSIRILKSAGSQIGFLIESDIQDIGDKLNSTLVLIGREIGRTMTREDYSFETMGSSLGSSFFTQIMRALIFAFIFMGIVVFLYFRNFVPSTAVILSALSDIVVTIAVINIIGFKIGTAGIAALLMLIGYSIDTDIMLTTKVLKRKELDVKQSVKSAFKTGMTMTITTLVALTVALIFAQSEVIKQIMTILLIGLSIDIINTWLQNCGLLLWYIEKKAK